MKNYVALIALLSGAVLTGAQTPHAYAFTNGRWFTGDGFSDTTMYVRDGHLSTAAAAVTAGEKVETIDLAGQYVVPPFADAHAHNISRAMTDAELKPYVQAGIFYVMNPSTLGPAPGEATPARTDSPVEVLFANGPITPSGGHPVELSLRSLERGGMPGLTRDSLDGRAFFVADAPADLARVFPALLASRPDFVKIYLGFSEEYERRRTGDAFSGKRGVSIEVLRDAVMRAHAAKLRIAAHIETAADFRAALDAGVDIIEHLPGWRVGAASGFADPSVDRWLLTPQDGARAASQHTIVVTTTVAGKKLLNPDAPEYAATREIHTKNLQMLKAAGVRLVIGSDYYEGNAVVEALMLGMQPLFGAGIQPLGSFSNTELLKMWCDATPQAMFPGRTIGRLAEGYEASFLVLRGDPIDDFANVRRITRRFKNGRPIG